MAGQKQISDEKVNLIPLDLPTMKQHQRHNIKARVEIRFRSNCDKTLIMMNNTRRYPDFPNFGPKFPERSFRVYFKSSSKMIAMIAFHRHQNHDHSCFSSKKIDVESQYFGQKLT